MEGKDADQDDHKIQVIIVGSFNPFLIEEFHNSIAGISLPSNNFDLFLLQ